MSEWKPTKDENPDFTCRCGSNEVEYYKWTSDDEAHEDHHYRCKACKRDWWVDGSDY